MQPISFFILATHFMHTLGEFHWGISENSQFIDDLEFIISFRNFRFYYLKEKKKWMKKNKDFPHGQKYIRIFTLHFLMFQCKKHVTNLLFDKMI